MRGWPWRALGIAQTGDRAAIRRAYADKLREMDLDREIDAYAELRAARDVALRQASETVSPLADDEAFDDADLLARDPAADPESDRHGGELGLDWPVEERDFDFDWDDVGLHDVPRREYGPGADPDPPEVAATQQVEEQMRRLGTLFFPNGEYSAEPLTWAEFGQAEESVGAILDHALEGDIGTHSAIDEYLAEMLAQAWPRSAPLLERVSVAFGWLDQSGVIVERPALQFLNPRLRGMRFTDNVEQSDHPLHKAWEELKRPGKRSFFDGLRIKREEIHTLLGGIRERYPELESHLDPERVESWEKPGPEWVGWIIRRLFVLFLVVQALRFCGDALPDPPQQPVVPEVEVTQSEETIPPADFLREMFGTNATSAELVTAAPALAGQVGNIRYGSRYDGRESAVREGAYLIRHLTHRAIEKAPFDDLLVIHALRRDAAMAVRAEEGDEACTEFLRSARLPEGFELPGHIRARERRLGWKMVEAGLMDPNEDLGGPETAPVPAWVFDRVARATGATDAQIEAEFSGKDRSRSCAIRIALVDALLSRPGDVPADLLRLR